MKKDKNPKNLLTKAHYPGGKRAMDKFVKDNMQYPLEAIEKKLEGDVELSYRVGSHGKVLDVKVLKGLSKEFDKEAKRLVKLLRFKPQTNKKIKTYHNLSITIHFRLPKQRKARPKEPVQKKPAAKRKVVKAAPKKPAAPAVHTVYNYTYVPAKASTEKPKGKSPRVYNFKINKR